MNASPIESCELLPLPLPREPVDRVATALPRDREDVFLPPLAPPADLLVAFLAILFLLHVRIQHA
jgi:hypothetical protein